MKKYEVLVTRQNNVETIKYTLDASDVYDDRAADKASQIGAIVPLQYSDEDGKRSITSYVHGDTSLSSILNDTLGKKEVLCILSGLVSIFEIGTQGIPVSYILKDKDYIYVNKETLAVKCILIPVKQEIMPLAEIPVFFREIVSEMMFSEQDKDNYVAKILTLINSDDFSVGKLKTLLGELLDEMGLFVSRENGLVSMADKAPAGTGSEVKVNKLGVMNNMQNALYAQNGQQPNPQMMGQQPNPQMMGQPPQMGQPNPQMMNRQPNPMMGQQPNPQMMGQQPNPMMGQQPNPQMMNRQPNPMMGQQPNPQMMNRQPNPMMGQQPNPQMMNRQPNPAANQPINGMPQVPRPVTTSPMGQPPIAGQQPNPQMMNRQPNPVMGQPNPQMMGQQPNPQMMNRQPNPAANPPINGMPQTPRPVTTSPMGQPPIAGQQPNPQMMNRQPNPVMGQQPNPMMGQQPNQPKAEEMPKETAKEEPKQMPEEKPLKESAPKEEQEAAQPETETLTPSFEKKEEDVPHGNLVGQMGVKPIPHIVRKKTGEEIFITKPEFLIGKSKTKTDYAIEDNAAISRVHCMIVQHDGVNYIKDNHSTNHTYLNGVELEPEKETLLKHKTVIQMGDEEFTFLLRKGD